MLYYMHYSIKSVVPDESVPGSGFVVL